MIGGCSCNGDLDPDQTSGAWPVVGSRALDGPVALVGFCGPVGPDLLVEPDGWPEPN
jgi:hypothetical protein